MGSCRTLVSFFAQLRRKLTEADRAEKRRQADERHMTVSGHFHVLCHLTEELNNGTAVGRCAHNMIFCNSKYDRTEERGRLEIFQ
jgi:hypothetical protein